MTGAIIGLVSTNGRFFVWLLGYVMGIMVDVVHTQYDLIQEEKSVLASAIENIDEFSESESDSEKESSDSEKESEKDDENPSLPVPYITQKIDATPEDVVPDVPQ